MPPQRRRASGGARRNDSIDSDHDDDDALFGRLAARNEGLPAPPPLDPEAGFMTCDVCGRLITFVLFRSTSRGLDVCNVCRAAADAAPDKRVVGITAGRRAVFDFAADPLFFLGRVPPIDAKYLANPTHARLDPAEREPTRRQSQERRLSCGTTIIGAGRSPPVRAPRSRSRSTTRPRATPRKAQPREDKPASPTQPRPQRPSRGDADVPEPDEAEELLLSPLPKEGGDGAASARGLTQPPTEIPSVRAAKDVPAEAAPRKGAAKSKASPQPKNPRPRTKRKSSAVGGADEGPPRGFGECAVEESTAKKKVPAAPEEEPRAEEALAPALAAAAAVEEADGAAAPVGAAMCVQGPPTEDPAAQTSLTPATITTTPPAAELERPEVAPPPPPPVRNEEEERPRKTSRPEAAVGAPTPTSDPAGLSPPLPLSPPPPQHETIMRYFASFRRRQGHGQPLGGAADRAPLELEVRSREGEQRLTVGPTDAFLFGGAGLLGCAPLLVTQVEATRVISVSVVPTEDPTLGEWISVIAADGLQKRLALYRYTATGGGGLTLAYSISLGAANTITHAWVPLPLTRVDSEVLGFVSILREDRIIHAVPLVAGERSTLLGLSGMQMLPGTDRGAVDKKLTDSKSDGGTTASSPARLEWVLDGASLDSVFLVMSHTCSRVTVFSVMHNDGQPGFTLQEHRRIRPPAADVPLPRQLPSPPLCVSVDPVMRLAVASGATLRVFTGPALEEVQQPVAMPANITALAWHGNTLVAALVDCSVHAIKLGSGAHREISASLFSPITFLASSGPKSLVAATHAGQIFVLEARSASTAFREIVCATRAAPHETARRLAISSDFNIGRPLPHPTQPQPRFVAFGITNEGLPLGRICGTAAAPLTIWYDDGVLVTIHLDGESSV